MNCPRCNTVNENDSRFCKNCGSPFFRYEPPAAAIPANDKSLNFLLIILGLFCFESLFYKFLTFVLTPLLTGSRGYGEPMTTIYNICSWGFNLITIVLSIIFIVKSKNKLVRVVLIVYAAIFLVSLIQYDILPLFRDENDFTNF
jgi:hypothetical protein